MESQKITQLERLLDRDLSDEEKERLRRIQDTLRIRDNDALWDIIAAMEYQKKYYDELPEKISQTTAAMFKDLSLAAEKEVALAQSRLAEGVVEQAKKLALQTHLQTWLAWGSLAIILVLLYGGLLLWSGFCIGSGQTQPPAMLLKMPLGIILGPLWFCSGTFYGVLAAKAFSEADIRWRNYFLKALACLLPGAALLSFTIF